MTVSFRGIIPPVCTVFDENGKLDRTGMGNLIDFLIDSGVNGLLFLGSSGEFSQISAEERKEIAAFAVNYVNGRLPVLIGTGSLGTREAVQLTKHAEDIGADGVLVVNPYYWPLSEENLLNHYISIADSVQLPILLYNFPELTGQDLSPDFVLKLVDRCSRIAGIKETIDQAGHIREMILKVKSKHPDFAVFSGYDDHLFNTLALGGDGAIPGTANFAPELATGIYQAFQDNDMEQAVQLHRRLAYLPLLFKLDSPFMNVIKEAAKLRGVDIGTHVLPPGKQLTRDKKGEIEKILKQALLL
ncbi:dihydrodipicolinate synthase family protein [Scopulibacillus cellulosilyticus]|uniref:Dihydrodipicolinate synthase family protein n=1 Tax=Scopulibacillus cellulosilyticus TaxID=2665665 RepID=A0ABW2PYE9_9BACL